VVIKNRKKDLTLNRQSLIPPEVASQLRTFIVNPLGSVEQKGKYRRLAVSTKFLWSVDSYVKGYCASKHASAIIREIKTASVVFQLAQLTLHWSPRRHLKQVDSITLLSEAHGWGATAGLLISLSSLLHYNAYLRLGCLRRP
jgi:hypothetical protein